MQRNQQGQFLPGPMSREDRDRISEAKIQAARERGPQPLVQGMKKCSKCKQSKRLPHDYLIRKRRLKSGVVQQYPAGECKECGRKRSAANREKLRREGTLAAQQAAWNSRRDPEARKRYQREYQREQRRLEGTPERGPWRRYRDEAPGRMAMVAAGPIASLLRTYELTHRHELERSVFKNRGTIVEYVPNLVLAELTGVPEITIMGLRSSRGVKRVREDYADAILTRLGGPSLAELFG